MKHFWALMAAQLHTKNLKNIAHSFQNNDERTMPALFKTLFAPSLVRNSILSALSTHGLLRKLPWIFLKNWAVFFYIYYSETLKQFAKFQEKKRTKPPLTFEGRTDMVSLDLPLKWWRRDGPANICLFKVNYMDTGKRCEICWKLTLKTLERR